MASSKRAIIKIEKTTMMVFVLGALMLGWVTGFLIADQNRPASDDSTMSESNEEAIVHAHDTFELSASAKELPSVRLLAEEDTKSGWNLTLVTQNFKFAPIDVNDTEVSGEGHAHLWVDGVKLTRLYSNYYYLDGLSEGEHEIAVTLNTNLHKDYTVGGEVIMDEITVDVHSDMDGSSEHSHSEDQ